MPYKWKTIESKLHPQDPEKEECGYLAGLWLCQYVVPTKAIKKESLKLENSQVVNLSVEKVVLRVNKYLEQHGLDSQWECKYKRQMTFEDLKNRYYNDEPTFFLHRIHSYVVDEVSQDSVVAYKMTKDANGYWEKTVFNVSELPNQELVWIQREIE